MPGHAAFSGALARIAGETGERRLAGLVDGLRAPLRVGVRGRAGAGCRTVARVLRGVGVVFGDGASSELDIHVLTEVLKQEDRAALADSPRPCMAVLNKADLTGFGGVGPMATAAERCRRIGDQTGVPTVPLAALLAVAATDGSVIDGALLEALQTLASEPGDLRSVDGFVDGPHRLPVEMRSRLLTELDLFGIASGVRAVRDGADRSAVIAALRRASGVDLLLAEIQRTAAAIYYRRILGTAPALAELSVAPRGELIAEALSGDEIVLARMAAAMDVVQAAGIDVGEVASVTHLRRAVRWQIYSQGPVTTLHRMCAADIVRGSLRLWSRSGGVPEASQ